MKESNGSHPLIEVIGSQSNSKYSFKVARQLLDQSEGIEQFRWERITPLAAAVRTGDTKLVKLFLRRGANPNLQARTGSTPLDYAFNNNNSGMIKILLQNGADPNDRDNWRKRSEPLLESVLMNENIRLFELLLDYGANPNVKVSMPQVGIKLFIYKVVKTGEFKFLKPLWKSIGELPQSELKSLIDFSEQYNNARITSFLKDKAE